MWEYYCKVCNKIFDKDQVELKEDMFEGDWEEFCLTCDSKVKPILKV